MEELGELGDELPFGIGGGLDNDEEVFKELTAYKLLKRK